MKAPGLPVESDAAATPADGRDLTLTFAVEPAALRAAVRLPLFGEPPRPLWRRVETAYFDTEAGDLRRNRASLAMRRLRLGYAMGVTWGASAPWVAKTEPAERRISEIRLRSARPILSRLGEDGERLAAMIGEKPLAPWLVERVRRSQRFASSGAATIEITIEAGFLEAGGRRAPVRDIRLRLARGEPTDLFRFAAAALEALPMRLALGGAVERGERLASDKPPAAVGAAKPSIRREDATEDAISAILSGCARHFVANWPIAGTAESTEAVHQMRVALRRLRAALAFFGREFPCPQFAAFRAEAKTIAAKLGEARDWDVFIALVESGPVAHFGKDADFAPLLAAARRKAAAGHAGAKDLVNSKAATGFILSMLEFLARRGWREALDEAARAALDRPVVEFAERTLERLDRKTRRRGRRFDDLAPEARHQLRIALKNVRYAADFFGHLFHPRGAMRRYLRRAAALQDLLGVLNDADVAAKMLKQLEVPRNPAWSYPAGLIAGWCARGALGDDEASRAAWRSLKKAKRPWRASSSEPAASEPAGRRADG